MKIKVGSSYQSNINNSSFLTGGVPLPEVWEIVVQLEPDLFIGHCVKPDGEIIYREFRADGTNGYPRDAKVHRYLLPNRVKKEQWGFRAKGSSIVFMHPSKESAEDAVSKCAGAVLVKSLWYEDEE